MNLATKTVSLMSLAMSTMMTASRERATGPHHHTTGETPKDDEDLKEILEDNEDLEDTKELGHKLGG